MLKNGKAVDGDQQTPAQEAVAQHMAPKDPEAGAILAPNCHVCKYALKYAEGHLDLNFEGNLYHQA